MKKKTKENVKISIMLLMNVIALISFMTYHKTLYQLYLANNNYKLFTTNSIWWNPSYDMPYRDLLIYTLSENKEIAIDRDNPYLNYFVALISDIIIVDNLAMPETEALLQYVGPSNMYSNSIFLNENIRNLLSNRGGIIDVYADIASLNGTSIVFVDVNELGDIYLYGYKKD